MEGPKTDCFMYYKSMCNKGNSCPHRHGAAGFGALTVCPEWVKGTCSNQLCPLRHTDLNKEPSKVPCVWESQPGGCKKPSCAYLHVSPRGLAENSKNKDKGTVKESKSDAEDDVAEKGSMAIKQESGAESFPSSSNATKNSKDAFKTKSQSQELKLERTQKQDAAMSHYEQPTKSQRKKTPPAKKDLRNFLLWKRAEQSRTLEEEAQAGNSRSLKRPAEQTRQNIHLKRAKSLPEPTPEKSHQK